MDDQNVKTQVLESEVLRINPKQQPLSGGSNSHMDAYEDYFHRLLRRFIN